MTKSSGKIAQAVRTGKSAGRAKVLGTTTDGVRILKPRGKATHFTQKELREAVASARAAERTR